CAEALHLAACEPARPCAVLFPGCVASEAAPPSDWSRRGWRAFSANVPRPPPAAAASSLISLRRPTTRDGTRLRIRPATSLSALKRGWDPPACDREPVPVRQRALKPYTFPLAKKPGLAPGCFFWRLEGGGLSSGTGCPAREVTHSRRRALSS